jgi:hypothetical protein
MERLEAKAKISQLIGTDLRPLADKLQVTVKKEDGIAVPRSQETGVRREKLTTYRFHGLRVS